MTALNTFRDTPMRPQAAASEFTHPEVQDGVVIWSGSIVALERGKAVPGRAVAGLLIVGVARDSVDNRTFLAPPGGSKRRVPVLGGTAQFENSPGTDEIGADDIGRRCYVVDDRTLARTDGGGTRSVAGTIREIGRDRRVWVELGSAMTLEASAR
jgi:hypothetical protein